jgi:hypothetical protein
VRGCSSKYACTLLHCGRGISSNSMQLKVLLSMF